MEGIDDLIAEKTVCQRINENAKRVLTEIGINIGESQLLMDHFMEAGAVDFENETALFVPLKRDYIDHCLEQGPRKIPGDPGVNTFGTGATSPFLKRTNDEELRPANCREYEEIILALGEQQYIVCIFNLLVACNKSISLIGRGRQAHGEKLSRTQDDHSQYDERC